MPELDHVTRIRQLQQLPPTCEDDTRVGHRLKHAGRPDRFETVLPVLLSTYSSVRLHEYDEANYRGR
jgi:hypothetical protein